MFLKKIIFIASLIYSSLAISANIPQGETIYSCGDGAGWPPYTYETQKQEVVGYDVDILDKILSKHNLQSIVKMEPWKRCLRAADDGAEYQIALSASYSKERDTKYLLSRSYYTITPSYFYSKKRYPLGLNINTVNDFKSYKVCGLLGYNYANFGAAEDIIDTGTKSFDQLVEKTDRGRCDLFLARYETFISFAYMGENFVEIYNLGFAPIPEIKPEKFYLLISRNYQYASELKQLIDSELSLFESQGELEPMISSSIQSLKKRFAK